MDSPTAAISMYQQWNRQGLLGQSPSSFYNEYSPWNNIGKWTAVAVTFYRNGNRVFVDDDEK